MPLAQDTRALTCDCPLPQDPPCACFAGSGQEPSGTPRRDCASLHCPAGSWLEPRSPIPDPVKAEGHVHFVGSFRSANLKQTALAIILALMLLSAFNITACTLGVHKLTPAPVTLSPNWTVSLHLVNTAFAGVLSALSVLFVLFQLQVWVDGPRRAVLHQQTPQQHLSWRWKTTAQLYRAAGGAGALWGDNCVGNFHLRKVAKSRGAGSVVQVLEPGDFQGQVKNSFAGGEGHSSPPK